jgi:DNA repair exonuclease SbcCD ATPase subunit
MHPRMAYQLFDHVEGLRPGSSNMTATYWRVVVLAGLAWISAVGPVWAQVLEPEALQRKQEDQQRARTMTRDLLGGVLDIQLRQLEENGLGDQEIFRDIKLMRANLNQLVETEMSKVVDLLAEAQRMPPEKREAAFVEARQQIRTVVRQLAVERQNLMKRLKIAELAEQVRRLIRVETAVQTATRGLPAESKTRQEALTLKTIEDQRDVKELFLHLVDTMIDMKSWSGTLSMAAADGLRILKAGDVGKHLDGAGTTLQAVKFEAAADHQEHVIKGLRDLLKVIERAQGALNSEKMAVIDKIKALADKQKDLREETRKLEENQTPSAELVEQQAKLQKDISQLTDTIRDNSKAETHIQQAETAALDAAADLLDNKLEKAIDDQGKVLGNLAALEQALKDQAKQQSKDKSATELAKTVKSLEEVKKQLEEAQKKQDTAEAKAEQNAQAAAPEEKSAADKIKEAMDSHELPSAVENALAEAVDAAKEAEKNLAEAKPEKATAVEEKALDKAQDALERAKDTVDAAIADAKRQESAVKIGELARAAEVLERAAAEERAIAKDAEQIAKTESADKAATSEAAKDLAERQEDVKAIAEKAAEALAETAPEASKDAAAAAQEANESGKDLQSVADQKAADPKAAATEAAAEAKNAAQKLAEAAKELRQEIAKTAKELAAMSQEQAKELATARDAVEKAIDGLPTDDKVAQLEAAKDKLNEAMQEQAKAEGKPEAAAAMELANQIAEVQDTQDAANAAADAA